MNRKQLRGAICGSAVVLTLGGGLLSQASGDGGFISRLWDKRPRMSESRLNPRNWFAEDEKAKAPAPTSDPVVAVRPELTQNPFASDTTVLPGAGTAAASGTSAVTATKTAAGQPAAQVAETSAVPAPNIDSIFRRPSADMIEQARQRRAGDEETDAESAQATVAAARSGQSATRASQPASQPSTGRVSLGTLSGDAAASGTASGNARGYVRVGETGSGTRTDAGATAPATSAQPQSAYERLLSQIQAAGDSTATVPSGSRLTDEAPRLPDGLNVNPFAETAQQSAATPQVAATEVPQAAPHAAATTQPTVSPADTRAQTIDDMIARSRAEMTSTILAQQAQQEREAAADRAALTAQDTVPAVSQTGGLTTGTAPPLMIPNGFDSGSFRTYGEADRMAVDPLEPPIQRYQRTVPAQTPETAVPGLSRIEQAARSAQQKAGTPAIVPGPAGSGVIINNARYSEVRPRVTSNGAPSMSVPNNSAFRRLSYERRADELAGQVNALAATESTDPILIIPGESLPPSSASAAGDEQPAAAGAGGQAAASAATNVIDWPDEEDLAPVKPKSGGTSWGLIVFCLALLTAATHIVISRLRHSRTAGSAGKS